MYLVSEEYQLDKPYFPGSAIHLGVDVSVSISIPFLESPLNIILRDLHYLAVWAELLFVFRAEGLHFCIVFGIISHSGRR
jgi:hypothetical protein